MNRGLRRKASICEWDDVKQQNPNFAEHMEEVIEKLMIINNKEVCFDNDKKEMVNHPSHYGGADNLYEAIKVIEAWEADFNIGTALRYLCRCGKKTIGGNSEEMRLEDLKKAAWYLNREIENIEKVYKNGE